jgi:hypothetical protein
VDWPALLTGESREIYTSGDWFYDTYQNFTWLDDLALDLFEDPNYVYDESDPWAREKRFTELKNSGMETINQWFGDLFGMSQETQGVQSLPPMDYTQVLDMAGAEHVYRDNVAESDYWYIEGVTYFHESLYGQYITKLEDGRYYVKYIGSFDDFINYGVMSEERFPATSGGIQIIVYDEGSTTNTMFSEMGYDTSIRVLIHPENVAYKNQMRGNNYIKAGVQDLGLPSVDYTNDIAAIMEKLNALEGKIDKIPVEFPYLENPTGDMYRDFYDWTQLMQNWDPYANAVANPGTDPGTDPEPSPDPEVSPEPSPPDEEDPPPRSSFLFFPFSIPFDIIDMIKSLNDTPEAPRWEIPFKMEGVFDERIVIDLSALEPIMPFVRIMILAVFVAGLMKATSKFIKW